MIGKVSTTADSGVVSINGKKGVINKIQIGDTDFSDRVAQNVVTNSNASVTATIAANTYLKCTGTVTSLTITLGTPSVLYDTEYSLSFVAGAAFTPTFNAPAGYTIVYPDGPITTQIGSLYEVNFAVCAGNKISCIYVPSNTTAEWTDTQDATLTSGGQMLASYTAYSQGRKYTGAIPSQPATVWTPTTTDQTIAYGKYLAGNQTVKGDANLIAGNIKNGVSIFGVTGNYSGGGSVYNGSIALNANSTSISFSPGFVLPSTGTFIIFGTVLTNAAQVNLNTYAIVSVYYNGQSSAKQIAYITENGNGTAGWRSDNNFTISGLGTNTVVISTGTSVRYFSKGSYSVIAYA